MRSEDRNKDRPLVLEGLNRYHWLPEDCGCTLLALGNGDSY